MSLRLSSYVAPKPPKGAQQRKTAVFRVKSHFAWRKSVTKFLYVKTVSDKVIRHSLAYLSVQKLLLGTTTSIWNFGSNWPRWSEIADFLSIFARSASAVTPREKKVELTLIGSPLRAFQWTSVEHRTLPLSPQRELKTQSVQNLNNKLR